MTASGIRCEQTELFVDQCAHCRNVPDLARERPKRPRPGPWFAAGYLGNCSECDIRFEEGDQIRADGAGGWLPECCGDDHNV